LLLKELLIIDLNYRQTRGLADTLNLDDYIVRFPGCRELVSEAFQIAGLGQSAGMDLCSGHETSRVPVETSSGFRLVPTPRENKDLSPHLKTTINEMPQQLGNFVIEAELGHGGMGIVYRAFDREINRRVAIKVMKEDRIDSQEAVERFRREIRLLGNLNHENIVRAFHTHVDESTHTRYLVMEYVEGVELETLIRRLGRLPVAEACELIRRAAMGLQHAHENALIHRDLKPANLMLTKTGQVKVLDLGLARPQSLNKPDEGLLLTQPGQWLGTPHYMSPEQGMVKNEIDPRSDIYSLGCTLYKLLSGETPFGNAEGATVLSILMDHANTEFPRITKLRPETPKGLVRIVDRMTAKTPENRIASAAEVARLLEPYCKGSNLQSLYESYLSGGMDTPVSSPSRKPRWAIAVLLFVAAVVVVWAVSAFSPDQPENPAIDLLAQIDLNRDPVTGTWSLASGVLSSSEKDAVGSLRLPHTMPSEFQLEITAHRRSGVDVMFVHRSDVTPFALAFSLKASAAGGRSEESEAPARNESVVKKGWAIENRKPQSFVFRVTKDRLLVQRDGQTLIDETRYVDLPNDLAGVPDRLGFFIVTEESKYEFSQIRLTPPGEE
jgi:serine/threonine protein kinase